MLDENKFRKFDFLGKVCQSLLPNMQQLFLDLDPSYYSKEWREKLVQAERKKLTENGKRK